MSSLKKLLLTPTTINVIKNIMYPYVSRKWKKNKTVQNWLKQNLIGQNEFRVLAFEWQRFGEPSARPHILKQRTISAYQKKYNTTILVETGTYRGDMIQAQLPNFKELYSIELNVPLWEAAKERFRNNPNVKLLQGDSGKVLHELVPTLSAPTLFWLDGHYCGTETSKGELECPIYGELKAIFKSGIIHTILIDDARYFVGKRDYPTLKELTDFVHSTDQRYKLLVEEDIIILDKK
jgi:hypothetical protein